MVDFTEIRHRVQESHMMRLFGILCCSKPKTAIRSKYKYKIKLYKIKNC